MKSNFVITVPAEGLAPNGARPSAGTVLIKMLYMTFCQFSLVIKAYKSIFLMSLFKMIDRI